ncbi:MAG: methyltransferase family protein [Gammaproteobacteria bacterium]
MHTLYIQYGNFLFKYRNVLFPVVLLILFVIFNPVPWPDTAMDWCLDLVGILITMAGQGIRAAVIGLAYIKRGGVNKKIHADTLVTTGLFAHCRNPLYAGNLLILAGLLIIFNNPWVYLAGGGFFILSYAAIVAAEESFLLRKFGQEYERYCREVNRWMITMRGLYGTLQSMEFTWERVIYKDYTTMLTWIVTVILIMNIEHVHSFGLHHSYRYAFQSVVLLTVFMLLADIVRGLKNTNNR